MPTDYDQIAEQYRRAKRQPWRMHIEHHTLFSLLGELRGKAVLDLACGEGFYSRFLTQAGARRVVGVDVSHGMIALAKAEEARQPVGVEYLVKDVKSLRLPERFDVVVAAYLLNYAQTREELLQMYRACARHLKPGCRFVTVNDNPAQPPESFGATAKYGLVKSVAGEIQDGTPITYTIVLDDGSFQFTNYHLSLETHEEALREAGFRNVRWHPPLVSAAGISEFGRDYWSAFLGHSPVIFLDCSL
jgi:2-polyprenyl-3-methyl-5-hydroxy-6-metoxy-1,4-benzoquinol methylase